MSRSPRIGEVIKRNRQRLGLSQTELGTQVGASMRTVGNWERGETSPDRWIGALESVLKVSLDAETLGQPLDWPAVADLLQPVTELLHQPVPESQVAPVQADPVHLAIKDSALTVDRQHRVIAAYERQLRRQAEKPVSQAGTSCH